MSEKVIYQQLARKIESIKPEEYQQYLEVTGWRILRRNFFNSDLITAYSRAEANKLSLLINSDNAGYQLVWDKYEVDSEIKISIKDRMPGSFGLPVFLLEPLTEKRVQQIDEQGEAAKLVRPCDLKALFNQDLKT
ncbi:hypothetical protein HYT02_00710 [Candidatus Gottesmanbacteria bacterium]|nr:hypothetical protein [Candidatus Gottesmanbacteria bacterium]